MYSILIILGDNDYEQCRNLCVRFWCMSEYTCITKYYQFDIFNLKPIDRYMRRNSRISFNNTKVTITVNSITRVPGGFDKRDLFIIGIHNEKETEGIGSDHQVIYLHLNIN